MNSTETLSGYRILVVDDNPSIHDDIRKILQGVAPASHELASAKAALFGETAPATSHTDFIIDSAFQGQEGLQRVRQAAEEGRPYAMAFVDVRMPPGWDGVETIHRIWQTYPELQVVICTAYSDYSWEEIVEQLGRSDSMVILKKPFDNVEVLQLAHALTKKWMVTQQANGRLADLDQLVRARTAELIAANEKLRGEIEQRAATQEALRQSEERFSKAFQVTPIPLSIISRQTGRYVDVNDSFLRMLEYARDEILQRLPGDLPFCADPAGWVETLALVGRGEPVRNRPCRLRRKDGQFRESLLSIEAMNLGSEACFLVIAQDITEQAQLENQLRQSQKMEAIGQLAAGVAHDFNNILTIIQGHASLHLANDLLDREVHESLQQVHLASERAAVLTRQLLAFSRKQVMQPKVLNLAKVIVKLKKMLGPLLGEQITLQCDCPNDVPRVFADESNVEQILLNLAVNARDAMPRGGVIEIATRLVTLDPLAARANPEARSGQFVRLSVTDHGCGMDQSVMGRIFEPFFTTKPAGRGTGLGLSTVYGIVKQHGGWIEVASQVDQGSTFSVFLPCRARPEDSPSTSTTFIVKRTTDQRGNETVLVVEDEPALRALVSRLLRKQGYQVLEAADGQEALEVWQGRPAPVSLLLTDMVMPNGLGGVELARRLQGESPALRVVFTSGYSRELSEEAAGLEDGRNFLQKPYDPATLLHAIRQCLDGKEVPSHRDS